MKISSRQALTIIFLAGIAVYANSFTGAFQFDDYLHIIANPRVWNLGRPGLYLLETCRPLVMLSVAINYALSGMDIWSYHGVNLLIHLAAAATLFGLIRHSLQAKTVPDTVKPYSMELAFAATLLWTVHPIQAQSITYIIQRGESLMGLFYLLTLYALARSSGSRRWLVASVVCCFLGTAAKPVMATAPVMALAYDRIFLSSSWKELREKRAGYYAALASSWLFLGLLLYFARHEFSDNAGFAYHKISWFQYARTQPEVILRYLKITFWPHPLVLDYGWPIARDWKRIVPAALAVGGLWALTLRWLKQNRPLGFLGFWFFGILAPTSGLIPIADLAFDHRLYLPLAAPCLGLALGGLWIFRRIPAQRVPHRRAIAGLILLVVTLEFSALTVARNQIYSSETRLWNDVLAKRPPTVRSYSNLASALIDEYRLDEALVLCEKALALHPDKPTLIYLSMGHLFQEKKDFEKAEQYYRRALTLEPESEKANQLLGDTFNAQGRYEEAAVYYSAALKKNPLLDGTLVNMGLISQRRQKPDEALAFYFKALRANPRNSMACNNIGTVYFGKNQNDPTALTWFLKATEKNPSYGEAYSNAGAFYQIQGDPWKALAYYKKALRFKPVSPQTKQNYLSLISTLTKKAGSQNPNSP